MYEKTWAEKNGWEKTWEVVEVVAGIGAAVGMAILIFSGGTAPSAPRSRTTTWKPKFYRPTGVPKGWKY